MNADIQKSNADIQKLNASIRKLNADIQKSNADIQKSNADIQKLNASIRKLMTLGVYLNTGISISITMVPLFLLAFTHAGTTGASSQFQKQKKEGVVNGDELFSLKTRSL